MVLARGTPLGLDGRVLDHAWSGLSPDALDARLQELCAHLERGEPVGSLRMRYALSYRRLLRAGGVLRVAPFVTSVALRALLADGPVHAGVAASVITTEGKTTADGAHDPHAGAFGTHLSRTCRGVRHPPSQTTHTHSVMSRAMSAPRLSPELPERSSSGARVQKTAARRNWSLDCSVV